MNNHTIIYMSYGSYLKSNRKNTFRIIFSFILEEIQEIINNSTNRNITYMLTLDNSND